MHAGATPVFGDVRDADLNIDPDRVAELVSPRTKAVMPVDLAGQPGDLDPIWPTASRSIEDAAHAVESEYRGRKVGAIADATCFSLYATKNVAAGEGGMITTNDRRSRSDRELRLMRRGQGSLYDIASQASRRTSPMSCAAIALVQLDKLERHREIRRRHVAAYDAAVAELDGIEPLARDQRDTTPSTSTSCGSTPSGPERRATNTSRRSRTRTSGRASTSCPSTGSPGYRERYPDQPSLPVAERAGSEVLSLPLSPAHSDDDIAGRDRGAAPRARALHGDEAGALSHRR